MSDLTPITREEALLDGADLEPITRKEQFIKRIYDKTQEVPTPITREEWFLNKAGEGGSEVTVEQLNATENGTYSEQGKAYSPVIVEVPEPTLINKSITANGTYSASADNADGYSSVTVAVDGFKKKSIANTPTDIASFNDGTANPMPSLEISIEPVQSGSGDPSPSNVRPISGWDEANVMKCGKNLYQPITTISGDLTYYNLKCGNGNDSFTLSTNAPLAGESANIFFLAGKVNSGASTAINGVSDGVPRTVNAVEGWMTVALRNAQGVNPLDYNIQMELGDTATTYEPFTGSITTIDLNGTCYRGILNVTNGELTKTHIGIDLSDLEWGYNTSGESPFFYTTLSQAYNYVSGIQRNLLCDRYISADIGLTGDSEGIFITRTNILRVRDSSLTSANDIAGQLVYELATPQTYQLTPAQVSTLLGQNNIFADCGQILEGEYFVTL